MNNGRASSPQIDNSLNVLKNEFPQEENHQPERNIFHTCNLFHSQQTVKIYPKITSLLSGVSDVLVHNEIAMSRPRWQKVSKTSLGPRCRVALKLLTTLSPVLAVHRVAKFPARDKKPAPIYFETLTFPRARSVSRPATCIGANSLRERVGRILSAKGEFTTAVLECYVANGKK